MTTNTLNTLAATIRSTIADGHFLMVGGIAGRRGSGLIMDADEAEYLLAEYGHWRASAKVSVSECGQYAAMFLDIRRPMRNMTQAEYDEIFWELCERAERLDY